MIESLRRNNDYDTDDLRLLMVWRTSGDNEEQRQMTMAHGRSQWMTTADVTFCHSVSPRA
jgi:hypothetical protein